MEQVHPVQIVDNEIVKREVAGHNFFGSTDPVTPNSVPHMPSTVCLCRLLPQGVEYCSPSALSNVITLYMYFCISPQTDTGFGTWDMGHRTYDIGHRTYDIGHRTGSIGPTTWARAQARPQKARLPWRAGHGPCPMSCVLCHIQEYDMDTTQIRRGFQKRQTFMSNIRSLAITPNSLFFWRVGSGCDASTG